MGMNGLNVVATQVVASSEGGLTVGVGDTVVSGCCN